MHTIQEVSTNASIHTSLQTLFRCFTCLPVLRKGLGGKLGIFALLLPKNCSLGVCITQEELFQYRLLLLFRQQ